MDSTALISYCCFQTEISSKVDIAFDEYVVIDEVKSELVFSSRLILSCSIEFINLRDCAVLHDFS